MIEDKLNLSYYKGEDIYTDGPIEDEILSIVQQNDDLESVLLHNDSWPVLYHLSKVRENLLEWYDFDPRDSVLEIGSGCGAITGLLCEKCARVVGIDLSKKRSIINATRNKNHDNLEIIVGNFEDIDMNEKFDYVTLIGVLEYSIYYISEDHPFETMLKKAKAFLKPGGKLIVAIENKYGLKYWAGATEDHTGKVFDGIQDYANVDRVRTFSRNGLLELLRNAGFQTNHMYYPVPDYKLPTMIYSDDHLPQPGELRNMRASYDRGRYYMFDEERTYDALCRDNMFPDFSNSFLVISE